MPSFIDRLQKFYRKLQWRWLLFSRQSRLAAKFIRIGLVSLGAVFILFVIFIGLIYFGSFGALPTTDELSEIEQSTATEVIAGDGQTVLGKYFLENRKPVPLDSISEDLISALIYTEDARFYQHKGIDYIGLGRAVFLSVILGQDQGGGSTISQQLAKNLYPRKRYRYFSMAINKVKEMFTSKRLEKVYTKPELLELYLNTVPFGEDIYGVEVAANRYFGSPASRLKTEDAATLVGMLKANTYYNPYRHPERSATRRNIVLRRMVDASYLPQGVADSLAKLPVVTKYYREDNHDGLAPHFREMVRLDVAEILKDYNDTAAVPINLYTNGVKIFTTIDHELQALAEQSMLHHMKTLQGEFNHHWSDRDPFSSADLWTYAQQSPSYKDYQALGYSDDQIKEAFNQERRTELWSDDGMIDTVLAPIDSLRYYLRMLNVGMIATEPTNGAIRVWIGGKDYEHFKYDHVESTRPVGSTFKPIVYAEALQQNWTPCTYISNDSLYFPEYDNWRPRNASNEYGGYYSLAGSLANSVNVVAVRLGMEVGLDSIEAMSSQLGFGHEIPIVPSVTLGTAEGDLRDLVTVYANFLKGYHSAPYYLERIENQAGDTIYMAEVPITQEGLDYNTSKTMTAMLAKAVNEGTGRQLRSRYNLRMPLAGKTGTTQNQSDGYFVGYSTGLVAAVWVGGEMPSVRFRSLRLGQGSHLALPIFGQWMSDISKRKSLHKYIKGQFFNGDTSALASLRCPSYIDWQNWTMYTPIDTADAKSPPDLTQKRKRPDQPKPKAKKRTKKKKKRKNWFDRIFGN